MGLQQFEPCRGLHLAGDNGSQILFDWQFVDGGNLVGLHHQAQRTQESLSLLALPMEIDADGNVRQRERGIGTLGGKRQLTILVAIPQDAAFREGHRLLPLYALAFGHVRTIEGEVYLLTADNTHLDRWLLLTLGAAFFVQALFQLFSDLCHLFRSQRHLMENTQCLFWSKPAEIFLTGSYQESTHIDGTRTDHALLVAIGAMLPAWQHHTQQVAALMPGYDIHHGFLVSMDRGWQAVVETAEQTHTFLHRVALHQQGRCRIVDYVPNALIVVVFDDLHQIAAQALPRSLQGQDATADGLQMSMVWCRSSTMGTII